LKTKPGAEDPDRGRAPDHVREEVQSQGVEVSLDRVHVPPVRSLVHDLNRDQSLRSATTKIKANLALEVGVSLQMLNVREVVLWVATDPNQDHARDLVHDRFLWIKMIDRPIVLLMANNSSLVLLIIRK
jgi:hypothetical protein